jgi:hypothetical protein
MSRDGPARGLSRNTSPSNPAIQDTAWTGGFASQHYCWFAFVQANVTSAYTFTGEVGS